MSSLKNILIVGVGGQGTLMTSKLLGEAAMLAGFDVKQSEVHGMAQRGGSVVTQVRFGEKVFAPIIEKGSADVILAMEKLEALRWCDFLKQETGFVVVNDIKINPVQDLRQGISYPSDEEIKKELKKRGKSYFVKALDIAKTIGDERVFNTVLLGVASLKLGIKKELWLKAIENILSNKTKAITGNQEAFLKGLELSQL